MKKFKFKNGESSKNRRKGRGKNPKSPNFSQGSGGDRVSLSREMRTPNRVQADRVQVVLTYPKYATLTSSGNALAAVRFTPNNAYDMDPTLGNTAMSGFAEYAAFYNYVIVLRYSYVVRVVNAEAFPIIVYVSNSNTDPGTSGTNNVFYSTQKYGARKILSASGGQDRATFAGQVEISQLVGEDITKNRDYKGTTTGGPSSLIYLGLGINAGTSDFTAKGILYDLELRAQCHFFGRKVLSS
jgi:hypothetical protein